ncbi:hypothetical protein J23TS9_27600 [Paenibacillus sp. J23TS9]|nr:hypothetical protein J23TS9_27600 [Paenibacillus sp. J23TS9]
MTAATSMSQWTSLARILKLNEARSKGSDRPGNDSDKFDPYKARTAALSTQASLDG